MTNSKMFILTILVMISVFAGNALARSKELLPIPDKLVVLTFDDSNVSDYTFTAPLLKKYGFGATFYIPTNCDWLGIPDRDDWRMTWEQIKSLDADGFEIGDHGYSHKNVVPLSRAEVIAEVLGQGRAYQEHGITKPTTFAYPGGHYSLAAVEALRENGYRFARHGTAPEFSYILTGGRGAAYDPKKYHPLLVPSTLVPGPSVTWEDFIWALDQARDGKITVLTLHGVPDVYPHCSTSPETFKKYMQYLDENGYTVIAMRDLAKYVDPNWYPKDKDSYDAIYSNLTVSPVNLLCEYVVNPLGIDTPQPRFSWTLETTRRDQMQAAYQILVSNTKEKLDNNIGDLWDSGKVLSDRSVNVEYKGKPLSSGQKCFWKVRCWNKPGYEGQYAVPMYYDASTLEAMGKELVGDYSKPATFMMGLLNKSDWKGKWIGADKDISSPLLRKAFKLSKQVKRATVHICGMGYYELYINGSKVGDRVLDPGSTYYNHDQEFELESRVFYVTYDVTDQLKKGANALGVILGNGWYSAEEDIPPSPAGREPYGDRPVLLLQMNIELANGKTVRVVSDEKFKTSQGPILYNDLCQGEIYDSRLEIPGWCSAGFDDSNWSKAQAVKGPDGKLVTQMMPPVKVIKTFKPIRIFNPKKGVYVYDFGQNFSGWTRLRVKGPKGAKVTIRHAAQIYEDGSLDARSVLYNAPDTEEEYRQGKARSGVGSHHVARQTETYILKGDGEEVWEPRFTLHGFRYAEVTGFPGTPTLESLEGRFARCSAEVTGDFNCSNDLINKIHHNVCWTFMSSLQDMPISGMGRSERPAWMGDPGFIAEDYIFNYDMASFWAKWLDDIKGNQKPSGDLPLVSPIHWRLPYQDAYGLYITWDSTYPLITWYVYQYYDDKRILEEHYEGLKLLVDFFGEGAVDHIVSHCVGDHMEAQPDGTSSFGPQHTPKALTSTAYYYFDTWIVAQAAEILGKSEDARRYTDLAEKIKAAFNREFFNQETNEYATGSQTSNAMALYFSLVPEGREQAVLKNLVDDILIDHNGHLSIGIIGTNALEQVLGKHGRADVMYTIATRTTAPSWGNQVLKGHTTLCEAWECETGETQLSYNMAMFGSTEVFFYRDLAGISPTSPGYKTITIAPQIVGDLTHASGSLKTVRGVVSSSWKKNADGFTLEVTIPVNSTAKVRIPTMGLDNIAVTESDATVWKEGKFVKSSPGVTGASQTQEYITFNLGSGSYEFNAMAQFPPTVNSG